MRDAKNRQTRTSWRLDRFVLVVVDTIRQLFRKPLSATHSQEQEPDIFTGSPTEGEDTTNSQRHRVREHTSIANLAISQSITPSLSQPFNTEAQRSQDEPTSDRGDTTNYYAQTSFNSSHPDNMDTLLKHYLDRFQRLRTASGSNYPAVTRHLAPHKPLLLLTVLDLAAGGRLKTNFIPLSSEVVELFNVNWQKVMPVSREARFFLPFFHLKSDGFWHLVPQPERKDQLQAIQQIAGIAQLRKNVAGAHLDEELYQLISVTTYRDRLRNAITERYFSEAIHHIFKNAEDGQSEPDHQQPTLSTVVKPEMASSFILMSHQQHSDAPEANVIELDQLPPPTETRHYFDLSAHPEITPEDKQQLIKHGHIPANRSWRYIDALLMTAFEDITLIGELPIDETAFHQLAAIIRTEFVVNGSPKINHVYPALFITSMVFSARYSDVNARSFWDPYAKLVWGLDKASTYLQLQCRRHFSDCRAFVSEQFAHLYFQVETEGDVARPVFQHVLIPYYLQDDFAAWLLQHFEVIAETPTQMLTVLLQSDSSLHNVPPRLQRFIRHPDTANAAAALIIQMAEAISIYRDGEAAADVLQMMPNPIEQAIWKTIAERLLADNDKRNVQRGVRPDLGWLWSQDDSEMQIRLTNVFSKTRPNLCVWTESTTDDLLTAQVASYISPWEQPNGGYLVDEMILADGPVDGRIVVLSDQYDGESDGVLFDQMLPSLPKEPIIFFRLTQQNAYGIPIPLNAIRTSGDWLVSMAHDIILYDDNGEIIQPRQSLYAPDLLRQHAGHSRAGLYSLRLPVTVMKAGRLLMQLTAYEQSDVVGGSIIGEHPIEGLLPNVPPAFADTRVHVRLPKQLSRLSRMTLTLRSQGDFRSVYRLSDLAVESRDGYTLIALNEVLPTTPGTYQLNLRQDLKSLLLAPLEFSVLSDISVIGPNADVVYSPTVPPVVCFSGIHKDDIIAQPNAIITEDAVDNNVQVRWTQLPENVLRLILAVYGQCVPLAWPIKRVFAWIDGVHHAVVTPESVPNVTLHVRGQRDQVFKWIVGDQARRGRLDARGRLDVRLDQDTLYEMLRTSGCVQTQVLIDIEDTTWTVFSYVNRPIVHSILTEYDPDRQQLMAKVDVSPHLQGQYTLQIQRQGTTEIVQLGISDAIGQHQVFPLRLESGNYNLYVMESEQQLASDTLFTLSIEQSSAITLPLNFSSAILQDSRQLFHALTQSIHTLKAHGGELWSPFQNWLDIHDADHWVAAHGYLPAWLITAWRLRVYLKEQSQQYLYIEPEVASHKGTQGIGRIRMELEDKPHWVYAAWERTKAGNLYIFESHLRLFFTPPDYTGPYSTLDQYDMWPAYQCQSCGAIIGSRSGSVLRVSPNLWRIHRHGHQDFKPNQIFHDVGNSAPLPVMIHADTGRSNNNPWEPIQVLRRERRQDGCAELHTSSGYALARSTTMLTLSDRWSVALNNLCYSILTSKQQIPMLAAGQRMLDRLQHMDHQTSAQVFALALLLRSKANLSDPTFADLVSVLDLDEYELADLVICVAWDAQDLLQWALNWTELLYVHTLC